MNHNPATRIAVMKRILVLMLSLLLCGFIGCATGITQRTIVEDRIIKAPVPAIDETMQGVIHDTVVVFQKIVERDTVILAKYFPKTQTLYVHVQPDTVLINIPDTVQVFTGYTDSDIDSAKLSAYKWGIGGTIFLIACGLFLKSKFF